MNLPQQTGARALEVALDRLRLSGSIYCLFEGADAWGLRLPAAPETRFHAVRSGRCWLRVEEDPPIEITAGEVILCRRESSTTCCRCRRARR